MTNDPEQGRWWGPHDVPCERALVTRLGPLTLWVARQSHEWRVAFESTSDAIDPTYGAPTLCDPDEIPVDAALHRVAADGLGETLVLGPRLADKAIVARPSTPFTVLPQGQVSVYMSTPLTVAVETPDGTLLQEVPAFRSKRTWLGANTRAGELCYASTTAARLRLEMISQRPGRVVTTVRVQNDSDRAVALDRVSLPVTQLSVFTDPTGRLWTERVQVRLFSGDEPLDVTLDAAPPPEADATERVAEPRVPPQPQLLRRVFSALFD